MLYKFPPNISLNSHQKFLNIGHTNSQPTDVTVPNYHVGQKPTWLRYRSLFRKVLIIIFVHSHFSLHLSHGRRRMQTCKCRYFIMSNIVCYYLLYRMNLAEGICWNAFSLSVTQRMSHSPCLCDLKLLYYVFIFTTIMYLCTKITAKIHHTMPSEFTVKHLKVSNTSSAELGQSKSKKKHLQIQNKNCTINQSNPI